MSALTYLIDTNVLIGLEDNKEIHPDFATLSQLATKHGVKIAVHSAAIEDIGRDKNVERRKITRSKLDKYPQIEKVRKLSREDLASIYGDIRKPNDEVDCRLLNALKIGAVSVLVTEDEGIHARAQRHAKEVANSVLHVADAVSKLRGTFEPTEVPMRYVEEVAAHTIKLDEPIFKSLRHGYPKFDEWWQKKCVGQQRPCWVVYDGEELAGIIVRKDETATTTDASTHANKILKICTFKVRSKSRGSSLGEHLLKKAFWFAQKNQYDLIYVTTYADQTFLIGLLEYYGFKKTGEKLDGEHIYEKNFAKSTLLPQNDSTSIFDQARLNYPRFVSRGDVSAFGIPIKEAYHDVLFPELKDDRQDDLFKTIGYGTSTLRPGNTIRKVYICRAKSNLGEPGSILFFYKSQSELEPSQAITTVGVLESLQFAKSPLKLSQMTGGRSVYSQEQLEAWAPSEENPIKVINFLLHGYFDEPVAKKELQRMGLMGKNSQQSIYGIDDLLKQKLLDRLNLGFKL